MTRARTPSTMLCTRGFSVCCETASSASSRGRPARASVASCRVNSARSAAETRRARLKVRCRRASFLATSVTETGSRCCSRSSWRMWRGVSPSRMPLRSRPPLSRAVYSNAPMVELAESRLRRFQRRYASAALDPGAKGVAFAPPGQVAGAAASVFARDTQHFLDRGLAPQHLDAAVIADRGRAEARMAVELLLGDAVVDHGAHGVIDHDELVDPGSAPIAAAAVASGPVKRRRRLVRRQVEEPPLVLARLKRLLAIGVQHPHQPLGQHADQARGQEERLDAHVAQPRDGAGGGIGMQRREHQVAGEARLHRDPRGLEVADLETARIAVQASLTGHLVLSTLHTNTAAGAITRLRDMGIEPFLLSSSLIGVLAQRLVRVLNPDSKQPFQAGEYERRLLNLSPDEPSPTLYRTGRDSSGGYRGRTGIYELIVVDDAMRTMIHDGVSEQELDRHARLSTPSIRDDGRVKVLRGETTIEEVLRVTRED